MPRDLLREEICLIHCTDMSSPARLLLFEFQPKPATVLDLEDLNRNGLRL